MNNKKETEETNVGASKRRREKEGKKGRYTGEERK